MFLMIYIRALFFSFSLSSDIFLNAYAFRLNLDCSSRTYSRPVMIFIFNIHKEICHFRTKIYSFLSPSSSTTGYTYRCGFCFFFFLSLSRLIIDKEIWINEGHYRLGPIHTSLVLGLTENSFSAKPWNRQLQINGTVFKLWLDISLNWLIDTVCDLIRTVETKKHL